MKEGISIRMEWAALRGAEFFNIWSIQEQARRVVEEENWMSMQLGL